MSAVIAAIISGLVGLFIGGYLSFYLKFKESKIKHLQECYAHIHKIFLSIYEDSCHDESYKFQEYLIQHRLYIPPRIWERMWDFKNRASLQKDLDASDRREFFKDFDVIVAELVRESDISMASVFSDFSSFFSTSTLGSILKRGQKTSSKRLLDKKGKRNIT